MSSPDWLQCAKHAESNIVNINHNVLNMHILETNVCLMTYGDLSV